MITTTTHLLHLLLHQQQLQPALLLSAILLLFVTVATAKLVASRRRRLRLRMPPGRLGPPLLGETLSLVSAYRSGSPETFADKRVSEHGTKVFTTHLFGETTVFSADPELNRIVLAGESRGVFEPSYPPSIATLLGPNSLLLAKGASHRRLHSLAAARFSSPTSLRVSLLPHVDRIVRLRLASWPATVRLMEEAKRITFDLTMRQLIGVDPCGWTDRLRREYVLVVDGFFSVAVPMLPSALAGFTAYGRAVRARERVAEELRAIVRARKESRQRRQCGEQQESTWVEMDVLEELLAEGEEGAAAALEEEEVVDLLVAMLVAGYETTSASMALAVKLVTEEAPRALPLLLKEHDEIAAKKRDADEPLDWSDYKSMPFTQCVINETLRVANIVGGVFRRTLTDVNYKGYTIPKGSKIFSSFRAVHMDPQHYEDARTFNPWRWMHHQNDSPAAAAAGKQSSCGGGGVFTPFGGGARLCPGYELARVEISVFIHYLVTRFRWEAAEEDRMIFFPTTRTLKGYPINVWHRTKEDKGSDAAADDDRELD